MGRAGDCRTRGQPGVGETESGEADGARVGDTDPGVGGGGDIEPGCMTKRELLGTSSNGRIGSQGAAEIWSLGKG